MSYEAQYKASIDRYEEMKRDYEREVQSEKYAEVLSTMPFEFLNAKQLCEKISLYERLPQKPRMYFSTRDDAVSFYRNLISFPKKSGELLENASYVAEIGKKAEEINDYVAQNPYLNDGYFVLPDSEVVEMSRECLTSVPKYAKSLPKEFRWNFIESIIMSLEMHDIEWMVRSKVIKPADLEHIALAGKENGYDEKIAELCRMLGHPQPIVASYETKLKGVTFPNDDGSSRQENLQRLKAVYDASPETPIVLQAESYTYTPEVGDPEPAIRILWEGKGIGNVSKDMAKEVAEKFNNPQCTARLAGFAGGSSGLSLGCRIVLNVVAPGYAEPAKDVQIEK